LRTARIWQFETISDGDIDGDARLLDQLSIGTPALARLWRTTPCLAVPARVASLPGFTAAAEAAEARGWPVHIRATGGAPVPQFPGMLNLALAYRLDAERSWSLDDGYRHLAGVLTAALGELGLAAEIGEIADAFCPGRYDLSLGGRKIAGLAQRRRRTADGGQAVLAHACLLVEGDLTAPFAALAEFEDAFMPTRKWRIGAATTIGAQRHGRDNLADVTRAIGDSLRGDDSPAYIAATPTRA
jgi:lipoate-protein ligase A